MNTKTDEKSLRRLAIFAFCSIAVFLLSAIAAFVYLFVDLDGERETVEIPSFVGQQFSEIGRVERIRIESEPIYSDKVPEGEVISQFPYGGARRKLAAGEEYTVRLTVSLGKEIQRVPVLAGYRYADAAAALRSIGANIRIVSVYEDRGESDLVLRTSPAAGEAVVRGQQVTLFVSRKHMHGSVCVSDLSGMPLDRACTEVLAQGLTLGEITEEYSEETAAGCVLSQSIAPNSYVLYGSRIDLAVSAGRKTEKLHPFGRYINQENGEFNESVDER